jgi:hypothetical protein
MKKIIFTVALLMAGMSSFACEDVVCPAPYDVTSGVSRFFSTVTGQNFLAQKIGARLIKKAIKKTLISGDIKADLKSYSVRDLKAGRFKSIEITGKDVNAQGVYVSSFKTKTLCNFNYIVEEKNGDITIKEDIPMSVNVVFTEDDLNKTMNSSDYKRMIKDINNIAGSVFEINSTYVRLKNDKMYYILKYNIPFVRKSKEVVLMADLKVDNGNITLANTSFVGSNSTLDINKFSKLLNYINPLDFSAKVLENKEAKFNIQNVNVEDKKITIDGRMTVLKDKE